MDPSRLNLRHLHAVAAIVRLGSVSAAASSTHLTQPAITQGVARLEAQLGRQLFERRHDGMGPNPAAVLLAPRIVAALAHIGSSRVTMTQLRALLALARGGSYVVASATAGVSQPSLHRAVHDLALALGRPLVERRGRGVMLTAAGRRTVRGFRLAEAELAAGLAEVAALGGAAGGRIAIGAMPLARARLLPAAVAAFHRAYPGVAVVIAEGAHAELIEPLRDGELDVLIGALREPGPGADVVQHALFDDRPVVLARAGHPLVAAPPPGPPGSTPWLAALARYGWTMPTAATPLRIQWRRMFARGGVAEPPVPIECGSVLAIRGLLMDSDFLTLLSPDQVAVELEAGWLARIADTPPEMLRTIGTTTRAAWSPTTVQQAFMTLLERQARTTTS